MMRKKIVLLHHRSRTVLITTAHSSSSCFASLFALAHIASESLTSARIGADLSLFAIDASCMIASMHRNKRMEHERMSESRSHSNARDGWRWGIFTARIPFIHTRVEWPELLQGLVVPAATGLGLVPLLDRLFGLPFEVSIALIFVSSFLLVIAPILFGEPFAPGWITPALPLVLSYLLDPESSWTGPVSRIHAMTALMLDFAVIVLALGVTGLGKNFIRWLPPALKGGILLGASLAAFKRVFVDDASRFLNIQPVSTTLAIAACLILLFSPFIQRWKEHRAWLRLVAGLGFLPGFLLAASVGPFVGSPPEIVFSYEPGILIPPFGELFRRMSPFSIGWPSQEMFLAGLPLAVVGYILLFGDLVTGIEILRAAQPSRPDEPIGIDIARTHLSIALRNIAMALTAPFFPAQGCLWTGVHAIIVQRWKEGRRGMESLFGGIASYYVFGMPVLLYLFRPALGLLRPLMGIALSLTLILTGYACAMVGMAIPRNASERGAAVLAGAALALFPGWPGMLIGLCAALILAPASIVETKIE
jgi:hypothetical protein